MSRLCNSTENEFEDCAHNDDADENDSTITLPLPSTLPLPLPQTLPQTFTFTWPLKINEHFHLTLNLYA